jgi:hypothetical protein
LKLSSGVVFNSTMPKNPWNFFVSQTVLGGTIVLGLFVIWKLPSIAQAMPGNSNFGPIAKAAAAPFFYIFLAAFVIWLVQFLVRLNRMR